MKNENAKCDDQVVLNSAAEQGQKKQGHENTAGDQDHPGDIRVVTFISHDNSNQFGDVENAAQDALQIISTTPCYDPSNPVPYFLSEEQKYLNASKGRDVQNPDEREIEPFSFEERNALSNQSILCWAFSTIICVGGSLVAIILTFDWTADEVDNNNVAEVPP